MDDYSDIIERIERLTERLERLTGQSEGGEVKLLEPVPAPDSPEWSDFLAGHPELARPPLQFTDKQLLRAIPKAQRRWNDELRELHPRTRPDDPGTYAYHVYNVLCGRAGSPEYGTRAERSECGRVVAALRRLEKAGKVVQHKRHSYGTRISSLWSAA